MSLQSTWVMILTQYYPPEPIPKPHELPRGLSERGHEVVAITGFPNYPAGRPVYLVEHNQTVTNPGTVDSVKKIICGDYSTMLT